MSEEYIFFLRKTTRDTQQSFVPTTQQIDCQAQTKRSQRLTLQNKMRSKRRASCKHVCTIRWRLYKSPITSLSSLLPHILDGRKRNAAGVKTHCEIIFFSIQICATHVNKNTVRLTAQTRNFDTVHSPAQWEETLRGSDPQQRLHRNGVLILHRFCKKKCKAQTWFGAAFFHSREFCETMPKLHVRVMLVIRWLFAAHSVDVGGPWIFQSHSLNIAHVVSSRDISLCCTMEESAGQWVARHSLRRCQENAPSAVYAARLGDNAGRLNFRPHGLNTAKVGSFL